PAAGLLTRTVSLLPGWMERQSYASSVGSSSRLTCRDALPLPPDVVMLSTPLTPSGTSSAYSVPPVAVPDRPRTGTLLAIGVASGVHCSTSGSQGSGGPSMA